MGAPRYTKIRAGFYRFQKDGQTGHVEKAPRDAGGGWYALTGEYDVNSPDWAFGQTRHEAVCSATYTIPGHPTTTTQETGPWST